MGVSQVQKGAFPLPPPSLDRHEAINIQKRGRKNVFKVMLVKNTRDIRPPFVSTLHTMREEGGGGGGRKNYLRISHMFRTGNILVFVCAIELDPPPPRSLSAEYILSGKKIFPPSPFPPRV